MAGPSIQGEILINTKSVDQAKESVQQLETRLKQTAGSGSSSIDKLVKSIREQEKRFQDSSDAVRKGTAAQKKLNTEISKARNLTAKAANKVANFEQKVRDSNLSTEKQNKLLQQAGSVLQGYSSSTKKAVNSGRSLENINTELNSSLGQLQRELKESSSEQKELDAQRKRDVQAARAQDQANAKIQKTLSEVDARYQTVTNSVRNSSLSSDRQTEIIRELDAAQTKYTQTLNRNDASLEEVAAAQRQFRSSTTNANNAVKNANKAMQTQSLQGFNQEFQNLTSSVQVALGPLSGVASRLQALQGLFRRNAAGVAVLLGGITAFGVALTQAGRVTAQAQKAQLSLEAQIRLLGDSARVSGEDVRQMAFDIAQATNLSVQQVRDATGTLLEFGGVGRNQFDSVLKAAQGLSVTFGGGLQQNIRKIGRAIQNPEDGLTRLESKMGEFDSAVKDQIESLTEQGEKFEATQVLLDEMNSLQEIATEQSQGLAGAFDLLGDTTNILAEKMFTNNGALDSATEAVNGLSRELSNLIGSDEAKVIGELFASSIENLSSAIQFAIDNVKVISSILTALAITVIPKAIFALANLAFGAKGFTASITSAAAATRNYNGVMRNAAVATKAFAFSLPGARVLSTLGFAILGTVSALNSFEEASEDAGNVDLGRKLKEEVDSVIAANRNITKSQAERFRRIGNSLSEEAAFFENRKESVKASLDDLGESIRESTSRSDFQEGLFGPAANVASIKFSKMVESIESGSKISQSAIEELNDVGKQFARDFNEGVSSLEFFENAASNAETSVNNLKEAIREGDTDVLGNLTEEDSLTIFQNQLSKLREEFDKTSLKSEELEDKLQSAKAQLALGEQGNASEEKLKAIRRVISNIRTKLAEIPDENDRIEESIGGFLGKFQDVNREIENLNNQLSGGADLSPQFDIQDSAEKLSKNLQEEFEKNPNNIVELGDRLGIDADEISKLPDLITEVFIARKQDALAAERQLEAQENLNDFFKEQQTDLETLRGKFEGLRESAETLGDTEALQRLAKEQKQATQSLIDDNRELAMQDFGNENLKQEFEKRKEQIIESLGEETEIAERLIDLLEREFRNAKLSISSDNFQQSRDALESFSRDSLSEVEKIRKQAREARTQALKGGDVVGFQKIGEEEKRQVQQQVNKADGIANGPFSEDTLAGIEEAAQKRKERIRELLEGEKEEVERLTREVEKAAEIKKLETGFEKISGLAGDFGSSLNDLGADKAAKSMQALALAALAASKGFAVAKAFQDPGTSTLAAIAKATSAIAFIVSQASSLTAASGGFVQGRGSSTSDSIPARLSDGEFVVNANAVDKVGRSTLEQINQGRVPVQRASGGIAGRTSPSSSFSGNAQQSSQTTVNIIDQRESGEQVSARETKNRDGTRGIEVLIRDTVRRDTALGRFDDVNQKVYGDKRQGKQR